MATRPQQRIKPWCPNGRPERRDGGSREPHCSTVHNVAPRSRGGAPDRRDGCAMSTTRGPTPAPTCGDKASRGSGGMKHHRVIRDGVGYGDLRDEDNHQDQCESETTKAKQDGTDPPRPPSHNDGKVQAGGPSPNAG